MPVIPLNRLRALCLQQIGTVLNERRIVLDGRPAVLELSTVLDRKVESLLKTSLCFTYSILLCGPDITTGFGKSQTALRLAIELSTAIVETHNLPKANAQVIVATTLDSLQGIPMPLGTMLVLTIGPRETQNKLFMCLKTG
jgi:hypothetical protein